MGHGWLTCLALLSRAKTLCGMSSWMGVINRQVSKSGQADGSDGGRMTQSGICSTTLDGGPVRETLMRDRLSTSEVAERGAGGEERGSSVSGACHSDDFGAHVNGTPLGLTPSLPG